MHALVEFDKCQFEMDLVEDEKPNRTNTPSVCVCVCGKHFVSFGWNEISVWGGRPKTIGKRNEQSTKFKQQRHKNQATYTTINNHYCHRHRCCWRWPFFCWFCAYFECQYQSSTAGFPLLLPLFAFRLFSLASWVFVSLLKALKLRPIN